MQRPATAEVAYATVEKQSDDDSDEFWDAAEFQEGKNFDGKESNFGSRPEAEAGVSGGGAGGPFSSAGVVAVGRGDTRPDLRRQHQRHRRRN